MPDSHQEKRPEMEAVIIINHALVALLKENAQKQNECLALTGLKAIYELHRHQGQPPQWILQAKNSDDIQSIKESLEPYFGGASNNNGNPQRTAVSTSFLDAAAGIPEEAQFFLYYDVVDTPIPPLNTEKKDAIKSKIKADFSAIFAMKEPNTGKMVRGIAALWIEDPGSYNRLDASYEKIGTINKIVLPKQNL